jgi:glyoxalase/bleomycin resistance protein/dioxygenase superfamily protein
LNGRVEYYTDILGLSLIAKDKEAAYLTNTVEHHSVILHSGSHARCTRIGFQLGPNDDLDAFEKQAAAHELRPSRKKDPEPTIKDMVTFEDPKGTIIEVFKRPEPQKQPFCALSFDHIKRIRPSEDARPALSAITSVREALATVGSEFTSPSAALRTSALNNPVLFVPFRP